MTKPKELHREFRKKFKERESILSQLINHDQAVRTLYNIILAFVFVFFITIGTEYATDPDTARKEMELISWNLNQFFPHFTNVWLIMQVNSLVVYYCLVVIRWSLQTKSLRNAFTHKSPKTVEYSWMIKNCALPCMVESTLWIVHLTNVTVLVLYVSIFILEHNLSLSLSLAVTVELTRFVMKSHSYFVEKRIDKIPEDESEEVCKGFDEFVNSRPSLNALLYFYFAPTLIYRDKYPRSKRTHWRSVIVNSIQFLAGCMVVFYLVRRFVMVNFSKVGLEPIRVKDMSRLFRNIFVYGIVLKLVIFYAFLHAYLNVTAELLTFSDRLFYKEFWQSMNMSDYYRKGTVIVQDWIFTYIYQPIRARTGSNKFTAFAVIIISGVAHEYVIGLTLRFLFPALFFFFAVVGQFYFVLSKNVTPHNVHNIFSIFAILFGWGLISSMYAIEYYSRLNCPVDNPQMLDYIIPRMFTCVQIQV